MSIISKKQNPAGLDLAYAHGSAKGQVRVEEVYETIDKLKYQPDQAPETRAAMRATGIRSIIDRMQRVGERFHENKNVAPADHVRMAKEFEVLKEELQSMLSDPKGPKVEFSGLSDLKAAEWTPEIAAKLANAVFRGEIKGKDPVGILGQPVDPEADPLQVNLKGRLRLHRESANTPFDSIKYLTDRKTYPMDGDPPYASGQWVERTVESIRGHILDNATTAPKIHGFIGAQDPTLKVSI